MKKNSLRNYAWAGLVGLAGLVDGCIPDSSIDENGQYATSVYLAENPLNNPEKAIGSPDGNSLFMPYSQRLVLGFNKEIKKEIQIYSGPGGEGSSCASIDVYVSKVKNDILESFYADTFIECDPSIFTLDISNAVQTAKGNIKYIELKSAGEEPGTRGIMIIDAVKAY